MTNKYFDVTRKKTTGILQAWLSSLAHYLSLNGQNGWANGLNGLNGVGKGTWEVALSLHLLRAHALPCLKSSSTSSSGVELQIFLRKEHKLILNLYLRSIYVIYIKWYYFALTAITYPIYYQLSLHPRPTCLKSLSTSSSKIRLKTLLNNSKDIYYRLSIIQFHINHLYTCYAPT